MRFHNIHDIHNSIKFRQNVLKTLHEVAFYHFRYPESNDIFHTDFDLHLYKNGKGIKSSG